MIDSHTHIYAEEFDADRDQTIERAKQAGVSKLLLPNIDTASIELINDLKRRYPDYIYKMTGLHPCSVNQGYDIELSELKRELEKGDSIAVGEIGIDLYWDRTTLDLQTDAFKIQCEWAIEKEMPVVIHSRESIDIIIEIIEQEFKGQLTGVFHCFTGSLEQAERIQNLGMYMGIGGVLTFKNSDLKEVVKQIDIERLLLETDAPYLAPMPYRGKRNEPAYTRKVLEYLAMQLEKPVEELDSIIEANTLRLFKI